MNPALVDNPDQATHQGLSLVRRGDRGAKVVATQLEEIAMSTTEVQSNSASPGARVKTVDMYLEVVVIPVLDVDRAKEFYGSLGWRLDADVAPSDAFRLIQFTPPGSGCSVQFGAGLTSAAPGSAEGLYLVVSDVEAARAELLALGVEVSEVFHEGTPGARFRPGADARVSGLASDPAS
jgi:catechol 2,3-dioxygenase-like lactoylglutathione lyase family enzyme